MKEKIKKILSEKNFNSLLILDKKIFKVKDNFFNKIFSVIDFYQKNYEKILLINNYKIGKFNDINFFIKVYIDFLLSFSNLSSGNVGYGNKTWKIFIKFLYKNFNIKLNVSKFELDLLKRRWYKKSKIKEDSNFIIDIISDNEIKVKNDFGYWI